MELHVLVFETSLVNCFDNTIVLICFDLMYVCFFKLRMDKESLYFEWLLLQAAVTEAYTAQATDVYRLVVFFQAMKNLMG